MKKNTMLLIGQALKFAFVGIVTLLIDVVVSASGYYILHMPAYLASGAGFLAGFLFNFPMNKNRVFHHTEKDRLSLRYQILFYVVLSIFNLIFTSFAVDVLVSMQILEIQLAKLPVTAVMAMWNFLLFKFLIFSHKSQ